MYQLMKKYRLVFYIFFGLCFSIPAWANSFKLIQSYPVHHPIFIQGLQLDGSNRLVYSAGLYGRSEIGYLNLATGKTYGVKKLLPSVFAEGLTVTDDGIWQITWREQMAFLRDAKTLTIKKLYIIWVKAGVWLMTNGKKFYGFLMAHPSFKN